MTPRDIRIAIAEANGYEWTMEAHLESGYHSWQNFADSCGNEVLDDELPDYCNDLNAMHEVIKTLDTKQQIQYADVLCRQTGKELLDYTGCYYPGENPIIDMEIIFLVHNSTALQRAEAYLRTIGKWKDE